MAANFDIKTIINYTTMGEQKRQGVNVVDAPTRYRQEKKMTSTLDSPVIFFFLQVKFPGIFHAGPAEIDHKTKNLVGRLCALIAFDVTRKLPGWRGVLR